MLQLHKSFFLTCFPRQKDRNTGLQWRPFVVNASLPKALALFIGLCRKGYPFPFSKMACRFLFKSGKRVYVNPRYLEKQKRIPFRIKGNTYFELSHKNFILTTSFLPLKHIFKSKSTGQGTLMNNLQELNSMLKLTKVFNTFNFGPLDIQIYVNYVRKQKRKARNS